MIAWMKILPKMVALFRSVINSSILRVMCLILGIARLASLMSTHSRFLPGRETLSRMWNGVWLCFLATGGRTCRCVASLRYPSDIQCPRTGLGTWQTTCLGLKASLTETRDWSPIWGYQGTVQFSFPNNGGAVSGTTRKSAHNSNDANIRGHIFFPLDWTQFIGVDKAFAPVECGSTVKQLIDKGRMMLHDSPESTMTPTVIQMIGTGEVSALSWRAKVYSSV